MELGAKAMAEDFGQQFGLDLECCHEKRSGEKIRHLRTPLLRLQQRVTNRELRIWKLKRNENEGDIGTKLLGGDVLDRMLNISFFVFEAGVGEQVLKAAVDG